MRGHDIAAALAHSAQQPGKASIGLGGRDDLFDSHIDTRGAYFTSLLENENAGKRARRIRRFFDRALPKRDGRSFLAATSPASTFTHPARRNDSASSSVISHVPSAATLRRSILRSP